MPTNRSIGWSSSIALVTGMVTGMLASSSACIIPDECIVVTSNGTDWCSNAVGALMWPAGHPELAQPVLLDRKPATGCRCFNSAENEIMWAELPADTFEEFKLEIFEAVRYECDFLIPPGWDHNCYLEGAGGIEFKDPYPQDGPGDCIGFCLYAGKDCGAPPNPYECEELYGEGETGSIDETDGRDSDGVDGVNRAVTSPQGDV